MNEYTEFLITQSIFSELIDTDLNLDNCRSIKLNKYGVEC